MQDIILGPQGTSAYVAVEVLGARTRVGHRTCTRASCTSVTQGHCVGEGLTI